MRLATNLRSQIYSVVIIVALIVLIIVSIMLVTQKNSRKPIPTAPSQLDVHNDFGEQEEQ